MGQVPHLFSMPGTDEVGLGDRLKGHVPAAVGSFHHIDQAGVVALVAVVVGSEQVAEFVERQLLRVPQPDMDQFEAGSIGLTAEDGPPARSVQSMPFVRLHVEAAISHREVQPSVGAPHQAVQVVTEKGRVDAEPPVQRCSFLSHTVSVAVFQQPQMGNAGQPHLSIAGNHAGCQPVERMIEPAGENGRTIGHAVVVGVLQPTDLVGHTGEPVHPAFELACPLAIHGQAIVDCVELQVVFQQEWPGPILFRPAVEPVLLGDIHAVVFVEADGNRAAQLRFRGVHLDLELFRSLQRGYGGFRFGRAVGQQRCRLGHGWLLPVARGGRPGRGGRCRDRGAAVCQDEEQQQQQDQWQCESGRHVERPFRHRVSPAEGSAVARRDIWSRQELMCRVGRYRKPELLTCGLFCQLRTPNFHRQREFGRRQWGCLSGR